MTPKEEVVVAWLDQVEPAVAGMEEGAAQLNLNFLQMLSAQSSSYSVYDSAVQTRLTTLQTNLNGIVNP